MLCRELFLRYNGTIQNVFLHDWGNSKGEVGMRSQFFNYQIYRKRFTVAVVLVSLFSTLLLIGLLAFFVSNWAEQLQQESQKNFNIILQRVQTEEECAEDYVWDIYSSLSLMEDVDAFFTAKDEREYIYLRGQQSLSSPSQIRSFLQYIRGCFGRRNGYMQGISILSNNGANKYLTIDETGNLQVQYGNSGMGVFSENGWTVGTYTVRISARTDKTLGEIRFWANADEMFKTDHSRIGTRAVIDNTGKLWALEASEEGNTQWLKAALNEGGTDGCFWYGGKLLFYSCNEASSQQFSYVTVVELVELLSANREMIWLLALAILLLDFSVIMFIYWSIHYDSVFLGYLLGIIERVEQGDFKGVAAMKRPSFQGKDEYSLISEALENMTQALDEYILNEYRLKIKQQETAMLALQHQINPHFLYNTLEAIRTQALIEKNPLTADAIALLGDLYRDMIRKESVVFFWEERDLLETYLQIMLLRFPDSFVYQIMLDPVLLEMKTPKLWLQPLAENFFSHGINRDSEYNVLVVTGEAEKDGWRIEMIDNGLGIPEDKLSEINEGMRSGEEAPGASIGLRNVYTRLSYYYGKSFSMEIKNNPEGGTCISIYIPNKEASDVHPANS